MPDTSLSFAKIVATPTDTAWSQAYNAGSLFIAISLEKQPTDETVLTAVGKEFLNHLESEFFTLEKKDLTTIKQAIQTSSEKIPTEILLSLAIAFIKQDVLYVFIKGEGEIMVKRSETFATLLHQTIPGVLIAASGYGQKGDFILLATKQFISDVPKAKLSEAFNLTLPNDIAETLNPLIHGAEQGGMASVIILFQGVSKLLDIEEKDDEIIMPSPPSAPQQQPFSTPFPDEPNISGIQKIQTTISSLTNRLPRITIPIRFSLTHKQKLFLSISIILGFVLISSIVLTVKKQQHAKTQQIFTEIYTSAKKDYEGAEGIVSLNKNLARDGFLSAQKKLLAGKDALPNGSSEQQQVLDLLKKIEQQLEITSGSQNASVTEAATDDSILLAKRKSQKDILAITQTNDNLYITTTTGVTKLDKGNDKTTEIIKNNDDWKEVVGIGAYLGNVYLLDKKNAVMKYIANGNSFTKATYFPNDATPDVSQAVHMAIDGSVWLLFTDGTISKFTKGKADTFKITGLEKPLSSPTKIFTNGDTDLLYVLDTGNNRLVTIKKDGTYQAQYAADIIRSTTDFDVNENDKKIYFLANNKIYELSL